MGSGQLVGDHVRIDCESIPCETAQEETSIAKLPKDTSGQVEHARSGNCSSSASSTSCPTGSPANPISESDNTTVTSNETRTADLQVSDPAVPRRGLVARLCGCDSGFSSCRLAAHVMSKDLEMWTRSNLGRQVHLRISRPSQPIEWDLGMFFMLQVSIVLCIVMVFACALYVFAHMLPTYWWMEKHLDRLWGFALEEGLSFTAPVWMGEFGVDVRGQYWLNFVRYLATRDIDFAYWAINGIKFSEGWINGYGEFTLYDEPEWTNESFGLLDHTYEMVRHTWKILDVQALMPSPATWRPDTWPCRHELDRSCGER